MESQTSSVSQRKGDRELFCTLLKDVFSRIAKTVPTKKNKELIELCKQAQGKPKYALTATRPMRGRQRTLRKQVLLHSQDGP